MMTYFVKHRLLPSNKIPYRPERTEQLADPAWWHTYMEPLHHRPPTSSSNSQTRPHIRFEEPSNPSSSTPSVQIRRSFNSQTVRWKTETSEASDPEDLPPGLVHRQLSFEDTSAPSRRPNRAPASVRSANTLYPDGDAFGQLGRTGWRQRSERQGVDGPRMNRRHLPQHSFQNE